ncbi:adenosylcobinamide-GDP ribazoletransferase [Sulfurimonas sp.]
MKLFKAFALAFNMLTIIPFFKVHDFYKGINGYSAAFYPLIGFLLGTFLWLTHSLFAGVIPPTHLTVIIFGLWVLLTGALHIDGFSDTVDGLFVSRENSLDIMKDSHVGGMGMTFTFVFLLLKVSSLITFDAYYLLPVILMLSRLNAVVAIYFYDYVSSGVGALLKEELHLKQLFFAVVFSFIVAYLFSFTVGFFTALLLLFFIARFFTKRLDGLSGDIYGFIIEVTELFLLNLIIFGASA